MVGHYRHQVLGFHFRSMKSKSFGVGVITTQFQTPRLKSKSIQNEINKICVNQHSKCKTK